MGSGTSSSSNGGKTKPSEETKLSREPSMVNVQEFPAGRLNIYYGSQTGTAARFARTLAKKGKERGMTILPTLPPSLFSINLQLLPTIPFFPGFKAKAIDLEDFKPVDLAMSPLVIFLMANYGEGEPTDNAVEFNKWMTNTNKTVRATYLSNVSFTVFGLGNRHYEFYNRMGSFVDVSHTNDLTSSLPHLSLDSPKHNAYTITSHLTLPNRYPHRYLPLRQAYQHSVGRVWRQARV